MKPELCVIFMFFVMELSFGYNLTILHTNDVHAHIEQMNKYAGDCKDEDAHSGKCFGGVARRLTKVNEIRNMNPNHTLFLDAGDQYQGTLWFNHYKGNATTLFMNRLHYDAMTFGNHEFDNGVNGMLPLLNNKTFPIINCNMDVSNESRLQGKFNKSIIIQKGEERIGIIGYLIEETSFLSNGGNTVKFISVVESVRTEVKKLKDDGVKIIIGLGHYGYGNDKKLAASVDGLDVIVGGHSHSFLYGEAGEKGPSNEKSEGPYPTIITRPDGKKCLIVQSFFAGKYLGHLNVQFDNNGDVESWHGKPILLDSSIPQDNTTLELVNAKRIPLETEKTKVVGYSSVYLEGSNTVCRVQECNLGNLITDGMVAYHMNSVEHNESWTDTAIAILNSGGIRAPIEQGNITNGDILTTQPFGNNVDMVTINGSTLRKVLEHSVSRYSKVDRPGAFLQVSGLRVTYDLCKPPGSRVVSAYTRCRLCTMPMYSALDDYKIYRVATLDFVIKGGDGYSVLSDNLISHSRNNDRDSDVTTKYINNRNPIFIGEEGRITLVGDIDPSKCKNTTLPVDNTTHPDDIDHSKCKNTKTNNAPPVMGLNNLLSTFALILIKRFVL